MAVYYSFNIQITDDLSPYTNWQMTASGAFNKTVIKELSDKKGAFQIGQTTSFPSTLTLTMEATSNILSNPKLTDANNTSVSFNMEMGDSSLEQTYTFTETELKNLKYTTATVASNTIQTRTLVLSNVKTYIKTNPKVTLTKNISNCTLSPDVTEIEIDGSSHILTLTPNSGFHFETVPKINVNDTDYNFNASGDSYTIDLNDLNITEDTTAIITADAVAITNPILTLTKNISNCTLSPDVTEIEIDGSSHILTLTPNSGFHFETVPKINVNDTDYNFNASGDSYTIDLNDLNITEDTTAIITADAVAISDTVTIEYNITNGSMSDDSETTIDNTTITDVAVAVKANSGYTFDTLPQFILTFKDGTKKTYELDYSQSRDDWNTITDTINFKINNCISAIVSGVAVEKTPIETDYGLLHIYKVTNENLANLSRVRFLKSSSSDDYIDLAKYIISIRHYPFNLDVGNTVKMVLGYYTTEINVQKITTEKYAFDSEDILINGLYKNASDILHSTIKLYLPFHGEEVIESKYINTTIKIRTTINIIANNCIFDVYSDGNLILSVQDDNIADTMPYILKSNDNEININDTASINMLANKMFIEVLQNAKVDDTNYLQSYVASIDTLKGYVKCNVIKELNINNAVSSEIDEIKNLLTNGFFI